MSHHCEIWELDRYRSRLRTLCLISDHTDSYVVIGYRFILYYLDFVLYAITVNVMLFYGIIVYCIITGLYTAFVFSAYGTGFVIELFLLFSVLVSSCKF